MAFPPSTRRSWAWHRSNKAPYRSHPIHRLRTLQTCLSRTQTQTRSQSQERSHRLESPHSPKRNADVLLDTASMPGTLSTTPRSSHERPPAPWARYGPSVRLMRTQPPQETSPWDSSRLGWSLLRSSRGLGIRMLVLMMVPLLWLT